jgi:hypothetical protein
MSDDDIRSLLGNAFVDEPPVHFTRTDVIVRGQRIRRKRRFVAAGSALASAAAVAATVVIIAGFRGTAENGPAHTPQPMCVRTTTLYRTGTTDRATSCECPPDQRSNEPGAVVKAEGVEVRECTALTPPPDR